MKRFCDRLDHDAADGITVETFEPVVWCGVAQTFSLCYLLLNTAIFDAMSNRVTGDFQHDCDEEVHDDDTDSASVPTPPSSSTFPTSTSSGFPTQQLSAEAYPVQQLQSRRANMSNRDDPQQPPAINMAGLDDVPIISENVDLTSLPESQLDQLCQTSQGHV